MSSPKPNFSVYREKTLIGSRLDQAVAHRKAKADAIEQSKQGKRPTYIVKGTFYDGQPGTSIGMLNQKIKRMDWKSAKPN